MESKVLQLFDLPNPLLAKSGMRIDSSDMNMGHYCDIRTLAERLVLMVVQTEVSDNDEFGVVRDFHET